MKKIFIITATLLLLIGCHIYPSIDFDFSHLGNTKLDKIVKEDKDKYSDFPKYNNYILPDNSLLMQNINNLLYDGKNKEDYISINDIEKIGAKCFIESQKLCMYQGFITYHYLALPSESPRSGKITTVKYKILFYPEVRPIKVEVIRIKTTN